MLHLNNILRFFTLFFLCKACIFTLSLAGFWAAVDSVVLRREIPDNDLSIEASSTEHVGVLWMELNWGDLNRCLQDMPQSNDMVVREVEDQNVGLKRFSLNQRSYIEVHVVNHTHGYPIWLSWVKLNARDTFALAVIVINKCPRGHIGCIDLSSSCCFIISKHLKIILEHINDLIRLEGLLNSECHTINKFIKFFFELLGSLGFFFSHLASLWLLGTANEVIWVVLNSLVNTSPEIGLSVDLLHLVSSLQTHVQNFLVG